MDTGLDTDALGRLKISDKVKADLAEAFSGIEPGKKGALLLVADTESMMIRTQLAASLPGGWKVAGGLGFNMKKMTDKPVASVTILNSW